MARRAREATGGGGRGGCACVRACVACLLDFARWVTLVCCSDGACVQVGSLVQVVCVCARSQGWAAATHADASGE